VLYRRASVVVLVGDVSCSSRLDFFGCVHAARPGTEACKVHAWVEKVLFGHEALEAFQCFSDLNGHRRP
jgi:hypothetical protein